MKHSISFLLLVLSFIGCKDKSAPVNPTLPGDISGKISLYTDNGTILQDRSDVQVSIESTSLSTITSSDGSWKLSRVPIGDYTSRLVFTKAGFITVKAFVYTTKGEPYYLGNMSMAQVPPVKVTELHVSRPDEGGNLQIQGKISSADSFHRFVGIIYALSPISISPTVGYMSEYGAYLMPDSISFSIILQYYDQYATTHGIPRGSIVYFRAYAQPRNGYLPNYNQMTGLYEIYTPGVTLSNLDSVTVY